MAVGAVGSAISSLFGGGQTALNNKFIREENQKNRDWQTGEREAQQVWQDQQRVAQNQFSEDMYNQYQSPEALVQQYKAAGLNPRLAVDGSGVGNVGASSGSSGAAPSGQSPATQPLQPYSLNPVGAFQDVAATLKLMQEARAAGINNDILPDMLSEQLKSLKLENQAKEFDNQFNIKWKDQMQQMEFYKAMNAVASGTLGLSEIQFRINKLVQEGRIAKAQADAAVEYWKEQIHLIQTESEENKSQTNLNDANASKVPSEIAANTASAAKSYSDIDKNESDITRNKFLNMFTGQQIVKEAQLLPLIKEKYGAEITDIQQKALANRIGNIIHRTYGRREVDKSSWAGLIWNIVGVSDLKSAERLLDAIDDCELVGKELTDKQRKQVDEASDYIMHGDPINGYIAIKQLK